nr:PREDICTED: 2-5A-dependent ribonuclease isoform X2 [Latimeria chalumnae]|eukprot:XP_006013303.1 PREDICTED: 2-5A-dependent ribonuclease isoform X2 [Latimeria chalumnae]
MDNQNKKQDYKYQEDTTNLLKFIRNLGAHFEEKSQKIKDIVQDPCNYFLGLFPDLLISAYNVVKSSPIGRDILQKFLEMME